MKYKITTVSIDNHTRRKISQRTEIIDTEENPVFASANACDHNKAYSPYMVEKIMEAFWNIPGATEIVKVIDVCPV